MIFSKPPRTPEYLAHKLIQSGLQGISESELTEVFQSINYYKLRGYAYLYQENSLETAPFLPNVQWSCIWSDYIFDLKLRTLLFSSISFIETALKTRLTFRVTNTAAEPSFIETALKTRLTLVSLTKGILWYKNNRLFRSQRAFAADLEFLQKDWKRASEEFKNHYLSKYPESPEPPAWMIFETSSFGPISKFFKNMKPQLPEKENICNYFGFDKADADKLATWFQNINIVRNICAHHGRLYSRQLTTAPHFIVPYKGRWVSSWPNPNRIYATICIVKNFLDICNKKNSFASDIRGLVQMLRPEQLPSLGFPKNWESEELFS